MRKAIEHVSAPTTLSSLAKEELLTASTKKWYLFPVVVLLEGLSVSVLATRLFLSTEVVFSARRNPLKTCGDLRIWCGHLRGRAETMSSLQRLTSQTSTYLNNNAFPTGTYIYAWDGGIFSRNNQRKTGLFTHLSHSRHCCVSHLPSSRVCISDVQYIWQPSGQAVWSRSQEWCCIMQPMYVKDTVNPSEWRRLNRNVLSGKN